MRFPASRPDFRGLARKSADGPNGWLGFNIDTCMDLFANDPSAKSFPPRGPLADRMRPRTFDEFLGQESVVGPGAPLREALAGAALPSCIFWGPPGSGKTTLARLLATEAKAEFVQFSAVTSGIKEIRSVVEEARGRRSISGRNTILFIDEIHRFNKAQQDAFLPHVEDGTIVLIGATTENPSFEVNSALLSRCRVFVLRGLAPAEIGALCARAIADPERGLGTWRVLCPPEALAAIVSLANGDGRVALNLLELATQTTKPNSDGARALTPEGLRRIAQKKSLLYARAGEEHYNIISALHKSMRGSDPDASLHWLARMLEAGEDPLYIIRRVIRFASEDIGMADPQALVVCVAAQQACAFIGMPECDNALAQAVVYCATAPKSNSLYTAYGEAKADLASMPAEPVPLHLRNAPTPLMKDLGFGKGYQYPHDAPGHFVVEEYLPPALRGRTYYRPSDQGFETRIAERMAKWKAMRSPRTAEGNRE